MGVDNWNVCAALVNAISDELDDLRCAVDRYCEKEEREGKWLSKYGAPTNYHECSLCGVAVWFGDSEATYRFCPYCGGKIYGFGGTL